MVVLGVLKRAVSLSVRCETGGGAGRVDGVMLETARLSRLLGGLTALDTTHRVIYMRVAVHHNLEVITAKPPTPTTHTQPVPGLRSRI